MKRVRVVTLWIGDGTRENPYRPKVMDDHNMDFPDGGIPSDKAIPGKAVTVEGILSNSDFVALLTDIAYAGKVLEI